MRALSLLTLLVALGVGCGNNDDPASYVTGLRVLAIKAQPPEVAAGAVSTLTALAIDTAGDPITIEWARCTDPPLQGEAINPDCITNDSAAFLQPIGDGLSVTTTMPAVAPSSLGAPDASGGVYLPVIAQVATGSDALVASYLLRFAVGLPPNQNPTLDGVFAVADGPDGGVGGGALTPIVEGTPLVVHVGDEITLRATFAPGSAEMYEVPGNAAVDQPPRTALEQLSVAWYATAGLFTAASSGIEVPDAILRLDQMKRGPTIHIPPSGTTIDLWAVARDERGGTDYAHRTLLVQ